MEQESDYTKYRGKCKEMCEALIKDKPELTLVRGWYYCPVWGKQQHWWCKDTEGNIVDPTAKQFPSKVSGSYVEFDGYLECEYCGTRVHEDDAYTHYHHVYCSSECHGRDVM